MSVVTEVPNSAHGMRLSTVQSFGLQASNPKSYARLPITKAELLGMNGSLDNKFAEHRDLDPCECLSADSRSYHLLLETWNITNVRPPIVTLQGVAGNGS